MEVREGYKQTVVGVIPNEWSVVGLGELATIERGKFSARPRNDPKYYGGEIPFLQTGDITRSGGRVATFSQTLNTEGVKVSRVFPPGTLLFTIAANIGDVAIADFAAACPDSLVAISPLAATDKLWLLFELSYHKAAFEGLASPGAQLNINLEKLRPYLIHVPPLPEQRAIATALSDVDALLDGLDRLIAKKRDLKQATMQQLLTGQTRLPGFSGPWEVKRLGEIGSTYGGLTGKTKEDFGVGAARYVTFLNVMANVVIDCGSFEPVRVSASESQNQVNRGDLLFNGSSETPEEVAMCSVMAADIPGLYLNSFCFGFRRRDERQADGLFLAYYLRANPGRELMKSLAQGSTRYNLSKSALLEASIRLPLNGEQRAIASVLSDMDAELAALESRRDKTRALKQGMMQELLTGKTRLV